MFSTDIKSLFHLQETFPTEESCLKYLEQVYWNGIPVSPFDPEAKVYKRKDGLYRCGTTGKNFTVRTGTMYEKTKIPLRKWFMAIWLITSHKKGIPSVQLAKDICITQKSAWFLNMRIRACFGIENFNELSGLVEADEAWYGGKNKNRHNDKKCRNYNNKYKFEDKTLVFGMVQRNGKMNAFVIPSRATNILQPLVREFVKRGSTLVTDDLISYRGLASDYDHRVVKDTKNGYRHDFGPETHSNTVENSWKIMKNSLRDMYNDCSDKHLQSYVNEFIYRYNLRQLQDSDKFNWLLLNCGIRTKYKDLIK